VRNGAAKQGRKRRREFGARNTADTIGTESGLVAGPHAH
jgi:hypothetical protein